jgi:RimJ/RimL family protein N-acetyltransferase/lysophospholipase L1-like esterase
VVDREGGAALIPDGSRYVAMGSSFAAGPGLKPRVPGSPRRSGRSTVNYAHLVAAARRLDLHDVSFSGATTGDILGPAADGRPAQLDAVTPGTKLVTITAGGNDVDYVGRLTLASLPWPLRRLSRAQVAAWGDPAGTDERFAQLERNLAAVAARLHDRAPACRVLMVDYLTILPPDGPLPSAPPPPDIAAWARTIAARLTATFQAAAASPGWTYIPVPAASAAHHAWSAEPWTRRFQLSRRGGAPYHPTAAGMAAVAQLVLAELPDPTTADNAVTGTDAAGAATAVVRLRAVEPGDVHEFFAQQQDPEANRRAGSTALGRADFLNHWNNRILGDESVRARTVTVDGRVAGYVVAWWQDGRRNVGYWLGRPYWNRGIGTRALREFLPLEPTRPLFADTDIGNTASRRLLERCGFRLVETRRTASAEYDVLTLDGDSPG